MKYLLTLTLLITVTNSMAGEMDELKQQQQRLQQLLDDVKKTEQQRDQQKAVLDRLQQQMDCNWTLIQSYEVCEQLYQQQPEELLECIRKAKANAIKCMAPTQ